MNIIAEQCEGRQNHGMWMAAIANDRVRESFSWLAEDYQIKARLGVIDARLVESTRNRLSESRELLARVEVTHPPTGAL